MTRWPAAPWATRPSRRSSGCTPPPAGATCLASGFYLARSPSFKAAVILEGIHYRYVHGQTVGPGFAEIGTMVEPLVASGLAALQEEEG